MFDWYIFQVVHHGNDLPYTADSRLIYRESVFSRIQISTTLWSCSQNFRKIFDEHVNWRRGNPFPRLSIIQAVQGGETNGSVPPFEFREHIIISISSPLSFPELSQSLAQCLKHIPLPTSRTEIIELLVVNVPVTRSAALPPAASSKANVPLPCHRLTLHHRDSEVNRDSHMIQAKQTRSDLPYMVLSKRKRDIGGVYDFSCLAMQHLNRQKGAIRLPSRILKRSTRRPQYKFHPNYNQSVLHSWEQSPRGTGQFWVFG